MFFLERVTEKENAFLKKVREVAGVLPLYIWGAGQGGRQVSMFLETEGIAFDGILVNRQFYHAEEGVRCMEELLETGRENINLIIAIKDYDKTYLDKYSSQIENVIAFDTWGYMEANVSYDWIIEYKEELQRSYDMLEDELSRNCFTAFLNQRVSMKYGFLSRVKTQYQYFDEELVRFTDREVFVDCGGYDGDSAEAFIQALDRRGISRWQEIISFEPDPENFERMKSRGLERHRCIPKGVSDKEGVLCFSSHNTSGTFEDSGDMKIEVDTIDHVVGDGNATMIKMDIEGSELKALQGAQDVIKRCHPLLAICLYHKREDLYEIPQYIKSLVPGYRFYIRAYEDMAIELVLYGIYHR